MTTRAARWISVIRTIRVVRLLLLTASPLDWYKQRPLGFRPAARRDLRHKRGGSRQLAVGWESAINDPLWRG